jgi:hypothetical protein
MFALIQNTKVVQIENSIFPVSKDLIWVACDSSITTDYFYINGKFKITDKSDEDFLAKKKNEKIAQLKANRNAALEKPYSACKAYEWGEPEIEENKVYFEFSVEATGIQLTEPNTIIFGASLGSIIKYSCTIIEGEDRREGYIILDQTVAQNISSHLADHGTQYVAYANEKEVEINACTTLEELNAININFEQIC